MRAKKRPARKDSTTLPQEAAAANKKQKKAAETAKADEEVPKEVEEEFKRATQRFLFNVDQIEAKLAHSAGMVLNLRTDKFEFDPELCTAHSDEELISLIRRQQKSLRKNSFGASLLSTPAPDPEEKDAKMLARWRALNRNFDTIYSQSNLKQQQKGAATANNANCKELALLDQRPGTSAAAATAALGLKRPSPVLELYKLDVSRIDMAMLERYHRQSLFGRSDLDILKCAVLNIPRPPLPPPPPPSFSAWAPDKSKPDGKKEEDKEEDHIGHIDDSFVTQRQFRRFRRQQQKAIMDR